MIKDLLVGKTAKDKAVNGGLRGNYSRQYQY